MSFEFDLGIISALTALVAVIVSPLVSIYVTRRQIRASVVSTNRQRWIDQLREQLAELVTSIRFLNLHRSLPHISEAEWIERFQNTFLIESKINLLLNPSEEDHAALSKMIREAVVAMLESRKAENSGKVVGLTESILKQSQTILKREWERVKTGD